MDFDEVGYLVHRLCGEKAFILERPPKAEKILIEQIRSDVNGLPMRYDEQVHCPCCNGRVHLHTKDLEVHLYRKPTNGAAVLG